MEEQIQSQQPKKGVPWVVFLINQLVLWALIITYAVLTQSIYSSISLLFLILSVILTIAKPYYLDKAPEVRVPARERIVSGYHTEKILWSCFSGLSIAFLITKCVFYFSDYSANMIASELQFFDIGSLEEVFLPIVIIPFSIFAAFQPKKTLTLHDFKPKIKAFTPLPLYLILWTLILLIQIFSVSITGLVYFCIALYLFWMKSFNFKDIYFRVLLIVLQVLTTITIFSTYLITCTYLNTSQLANAYEFIGIDSLNMFMASATERGHFICEVLLSLLCAYLNRLFIYQSFNTAYNDIYNPHIEDLHKFQQQIRADEQLGKMRQTDQLPDMLPTKRRSLKEGLLQKRNSQKVQPFRQQVEMKQISQRGSFHSDNHEVNEHHLAIVKEEELKDERFLQEVLNFQDENIDETEEEKKNRLSKNKKSALVNFKRLRKEFLTWLTTAFKFLNSPQFSLRVIEIISIIVIQRYNNVYSFVNLIWLAFVSSVENLLYVRLFTAFVILPLEICNFIITYFYNIPHSPAANITDGQNYGFQISSSLWLDVIIFNLYLNYLILFVKSYREIVAANTLKVKKQRRRPMVWEVIVAFLFRYTYLLTLAGLFFLGFSQPTVINIIYVSLFLVFFSNGDNLIFIVKKKGKKRWHAITTFSKHYWFIIVYFTLICIIAKYMYFLFFNGQASNWLDPTGINQIYSWSFNFSLSSVCPSNTTPFFIIFVLAEIQILVYRSYIYTNYSFSIMADFVDGTSRNAHSRKSKFKRWFIDMVVIGNQLYYQSLYYFSGIIIIGCSYRWSLIGLAIIALTCLGLLTSFNKKLLGSILFLNLAFLFLNYLILLINQYPVITQLIGASFVQQINNISLFIGFSLAKQSYASLFVLNIVIFYFCVICYGLSNVLEVRQFDSISGDMSSRSSSVSDGHRSFREPTIVDSEFQDDRFAKNYKKDVVESTKLFYSENLVVKYKWVRSVGNFLRLFLTDLVAIFVIIECLYFRLSVSMYLFLLVYLVYYFVLFDNIGSIYDSSNFSEMVQGQLQRFASKERLLQDELHFNSLIDDQHQVEKDQAYFAFKAQNILLLKSDSRKRIWKYSAFLSVTCLILTYASQFLISDFYKANIAYSGTETIQIILFVLGINSGQNFGDYVYFYYVMLIINILERLTIYFSEKMMFHDNEIKQEEGNNHNRELPKLENPDYLINCYVSENFVVQRQGGELLIREEAVLEVKDQREEKVFLKEANLLIYFQYKLAMIRMNVRFGFIHFMIRFYLWLMLINIYSKSNMFGFAYFIAVLCFWFRDVNFSLIRNINKAAIIIVLLQYLFLLLDINTITSPIAVPTTKNLSLLQALINNPDWVDFLAVSSNESNNNSYLASFLINSVIIFFTELCFSIYQYIAQDIITMVLKLYQKYESILQKLDIDQEDQIQINLSSYKSTWHRMSVFMYQNLIMNSYLIVSLLIFMLLSGIHNYLAIFLLVIAFLYIYVGVFSKLSENQRIFYYTRIFFRIFNILQFLILFINIVLNMPFVPTTGRLGSILNDFKALTSIEQIILILFIQVWIDLNASRSFQFISEDYRRRNQLRRDISLRCLTFQKNNFLVSSLIRQFKEVLSFDNSVAQAMKIIKSWHAITKRDTKVIDYDFQSMHEKQATKKIRQEIQQQQIGNDHKQFATILKAVGESQTDIPLSYNYYDTLRFIIENVSGIITYENLELSAWRFIKEDYEIIETIIKEYDEQMAFIFNQILENENDTIADVLLEVKKQLSKDSDEPHQIIKESFSSKLALKPENFHQKEKGKFKLIPFLLSNIEVLIVLLLEIYYMTNPCLLSLPILAYTFCYFLIANKKLTQLLLIYIFLLILAGEIIQIQNFSTSPEGLAYIKFFFYVDPNTNEVTYALGYLYFIFVMIFFNQEIVRFKGNKFRDCQEVQNLEKSFLRILMNQEDKSRLYLWKYSEVDQQILQNINPFNIAAYEIQNNLQKLFSDEAYFTSVFSDRKIGMDFYPPIAAVQIFLTIYLIFFYPLMTDVKGFTLQQSTKYYQFSSDMVIGVLVHVVNIVIERYITIQVIARRKKIIIKYIYTVFIFILFSWFIFFIAPYKTSIVITASFYNPNSALVAFSFFYFIYFYLSALQIKYGYKEFKSFNSLMTRRGYTNYYLVSAYTAIPFLYEIKIIMDWTFSSTSLTLYDWFRQFSIYLRAFSSKINYYSATTTTVLGQTIPWYYKIMGWSGFIIILLIIFGPMILFSGLNPIATPNLVVSGSMQLSLQVLNGNSFTLYETSHFSNPPIIYNEGLFYAQGFDQVSVLQQMTSSDIPEQFQSITYQPFSDSNWAISEPNYNTILSYLFQTMSDIALNKTPTYSFQLVVTYQLNRAVAETIASDTTFYYPSQQTYLSQTEIQDLYSTLTTCNTSSYFPNFYISLIRLNTINNIYKPRPIIFYNQSSNGTNYQPYQYGVTLNLLCQNGITNISNTNNVYWGLYLQDNSTEGLTLYVYCDKYQNIIGGYGFTALYTSIILVVAGFIRTMFDGNLPYIIYQMNPKPDNILQICEAINTLRVRKQFREEYLMYFQLIDIIRSPEIMKHLSGSYPYLIEEAHEKQLKMKEEKEMEKQKTL